MSPPLLVRGLRFFGAGDCLAAVVNQPGRTLRVHRLLPGEWARVRPVTVGEAGRWQRTHWVVDRVLVAGAGRVSPACEAFDRGCMGCGLLHMDETAERGLKAQMVGEILARVADLADGPPLRWFQSAGRVGERLRTKLCVGPAGAGLRGQDGAVVPTRRCPVLHPALERVVEALADGVAAGPWPAAAPGAQVELAWTADGGVRGTLEALPAAVRARVEGELARRAIALADPASTTDGARWQRPVAHGFEALEAWVDQAWPTRVGVAWDLTCGAGSLAARIAPRCDALTVLDIDWQAVQQTAARLRAAGHGHIRALGGDARTVVPRRVQQGERADAVLVNPMRETLGTALMEGITALDARVLLYAAPAPRAAAEDIGTLRGLGWRVDEVAVIDVYPGAGSVMMGVRLSRGAPLGGLPAGAAPGGTPSRGSGRS
jgi:tRNA/tmRNA/rRNA uracil-C5-methylase (TrmA/RlmC/RlmD family)